MQKTVIFSPFMLRIRKLSSLEPVKLAYASYESTKSTEPPRMPLIVLHGLFGSKSNWNSLCKVYQKKTNRRIIAIDARNHGDSPHSDHHTYGDLTADLLNLLNELNIAKVALLGHSMGGRAVMFFALKYPDLVDKLIVGDISPLGTSPNLATMPHLITVLKNLNLPKNVSMSAARTQTDLELAQFVSDKGLRAFLLTNLVQKQDGSYIWRINISALERNFSSIAKFPLTNTLIFNGPTLFVAGGHSDYVQKTDHPGILKIFPKAEIQYIDGAGHWLHSEKPNEFLQVTISFLNKN